MDAQGSPMLFAPALLLGAGETGKDPDASLARLAQADFRKPELPACRIHHGGHPATFTSGRRHTPNIRAPPPDPRFMAKKDHG